MVLHGDPEIPHWLRAVASTQRVRLVVNDPGPGRYTALPEGADVHVNARPVGFAANVVPAVEALLAEGREVVVCANFDLELDPEALTRLVDEVAADPRLAVAGPLLSDRAGRPVFSAGGLPTPLKELTRAAGLRSGRLQALQRLVLRRTRGWQRRNAPTGTRRVLADGEYLPWTCVAVRADAWRQVGPLDERFEMYAEDLDWGVRAQQAGRTAVLLDVGPVVHDERATRSAWTNAVYERSMLALHDKHGWRSCGRALRAGLGLRRWTPLRGLTEPVDWSRLR